jgi:polyhydroxyalkanoate synthase
MDNVTPLHKSRCEADRDRPDTAARGSTGAERTPATGEVLDHLTHAAWAQRTFGLSPNALLGAWFDWATHVATAPGKQMQMAEKAAQKVQRLGRYALRCAVSQGTPEPCIAPLAQDDRFRDEAWQTAPFNMIHQGFLLQQQFWHNAVTGVAGVTALHERQLQFVTRQVLDVFSPSNFLATNPEILRKTRAESGWNLARGAQHAAEDWVRQITGAPPAGADDFRVGRDVALTPGKVVYRNRLIELIQYAPATDKVRPEPVLIVPAWIMKYYILDLSPRNSLVRFLVDQGFTVFMISWKNPGFGDRDLAMEDYQKLGVVDALEAIGAIVPGQKVHAAGYCLGGTLLSIAAATLARDGRDALASLTLLASQTDFAEPGELQLFTNESQLAFLDDMMWQKGYLDSRQMTGAFQMLRSNDLIWSRMTREYLMGERAPMIDLMAWNADGTRMPYRMHSEYLRKLYLDNELSAGKFVVEGRPIALSDIRTPIFAVGTRKDHVAPWRSVFKIRLLTDTEVTFVLTSGGHNAGIVSEPGHARRSYQIRTFDHLDPHLDPDSWATEEPRRDGSWWVAWADWLAARSGRDAPVPAMGNPAAGYAPISDTPGTYVMQE